MLCNYVIELFLYFEVKTCHVCQLTPALPPQPQRKLQPIPPPIQPWYHIGIDLVCDLQQNSDGYKHLLVTTCFLSKFCAVRPLRNKTTKEVLRQLDNTLSRLKYFNTTKLTSTICVIYWLSAKLGSKKEIKICKYIKYDVSALAWVKISNFLVFREVLIY